MRRGGYNQICLHYFFPLRSGCLLTSALPIRMDCVQAGDAGQLNTHVPHSIQHIMPRSVNSFGRFSSAYFSSSVGSRFIRHPFTQRPQRIHAVGSGRRGILLGKGQKSVVLLFKTGSWSLAKAMPIIGRPLKSSWAAFYSPRKGNDICDFGADWHNDILRVLHCRSIYCHTFFHQRNTCFQVVCQEGHRRHVHNQTAYVGGSLPSGITRLVHAFTSTFFRALGVTRFTAIREPGSPGRARFRRFYAGFQ